MLHNNEEYQNKPWDFFQEKGTLNIQHTYTKMTSEKKLSFHKGIL